MNSAKKHKVRRDSPDTCDLQATTSPEKKKSNSAPHNRIESRADSDANASTCKCTCMFFVLVLIKRLCCKWHKSQIKT